MISDTYYWIIPNPSWYRVTNNGVELMENGEGGDVLVQIWYDMPPFEIVGTITQLSEDEWSLEVLFDRFPSDKVMVTKPTLSGDKEYFLNS